MKKIILIVLIVQLFLQMGYIYIMEYTFVLNVQENIDILVHQYLKILLLDGLNEFEISLMKLAGKKRLKGLLNLFKVE